MNLPPNIPIESMQNDDGSWSARARLREWTFYGWGQSDEAAREDVLMSILTTPETITFDGEEMMS